MPRHIKIGRGRKEGYEGYHAKVPGIIMNNKRAFEVRNSNEDFNIRTELHGIILARINNGISKEEIIKELSSIDRFSKYSEYFENWIDDKIRKKEIEANKLNKKQKEEKEK